ncbi:MAG TPA: hypothetical protein PKU97_04505, partial [Kofleriaceae bacterium]|nr:hypothetical protein [Kofleriaceae bacterium]
MLGLHSGAAAAVGAQAARAAVAERDLFGLAFEVGLHDACVTHRFDSFRDTSAEAKLSGDLRVQAVNFHARKPGA